MSEDDNVRMTADQKFAVVLVICGTVIMISAGCLWLLQSYFTQYWQWLENWLP